MATFSRQLAHFAKARALPFLGVYGGAQTRFTRQNSFETLELRRGPGAVPLDKGLYCDPFLSRHKRYVAERLSAFKPDLVHITGPGDLGFLGLWVAHILRVPLVASWHTNLHEYIARRLERALAWTPAKIRSSIVQLAERQSLRGFMRFYRTARFTLAPNQAMVHLLHRTTGRPSFLMEHGVDLEDYRPSLHSRNGAPFCIGYVGRLVTEKNVRCFAELESKLRAAGEHDCRFLLVGEGGQRKWLRKNLKNAELPGVLRGEQLAQAYKKMDAFVFPSITDTFGLVVLEAMASGVPVIVTPQAGARVGVEDGVSGFLSNDFSKSVLDLKRSPTLRDGMAARARRFASSRSWCGVFEELYRIYARGLAIDDARRAAREALLR